MDMTSIPGTSCGKSKKICEAHFLHVHGMRNVEPGMSQRRIKQHTFYCEFFAKTYHVAQSAGTRNDNDGMGMVVEKNVADNAKTTTLMSFHTSLQHETENDDNNDNNRYIQVTFGTDPYHARLLPLKTKKTNDRQETT